MEQFRPLPGYGGRFEVSDQGTVRTTPYTDAAGVQRRGRTIIPNVTPQGYSRVRLCYGGTVRQVQLHRLVLMAWGREPRDGEDACHNDGDPSNNRLSNLRWDTRSGNCLDRAGHGTCRSARKTHCDNGHPLSGSNVYHPPSHPEWRMCCACRRAAKRRYEERRRHG